MEVEFLEVSELRAALEKHGGTLGRAGSEKSRVALEGLGPLDRGFRERMLVSGLHHSVVDQSVAIN